MTATTPTLTTASLALFLAFAQDAGNWGGEPLVGGNFEFSRADRGNLTDLKKAGLVTTTVDEGDIWLQFTAAGKALALQNGITIH